MKLMPLMTPPHGTLRPVGCTPDIRRIIAKFAYVLFPVRGIVIVILIPFIVIFGLGERQG